VGGKEFDFPGLCTHYSRQSRISNPTSVLDYVLTDPSVVKRITDWKVEFDGIASPDHASVSFSLCPPPIKQSKKTPFRPSRTSLNALRSSLPTDLSLYQMKSLHRWQLQSKVLQNSAGRVYGNITARLSLLWSRLSLLSLPNPPTLSLLTPLTRLIPSFPHKGGLRTVVLASSDLSRSGLDYSLGL